MFNTFARCTTLTSLALFAGLGCATESNEKSTETNWLECDSDTDCARVVAEATCAPDGYCVDSDGRRIPAETGGRDGGTGGAAGDGGAAGAGGEADAGVGGDGGTVDAGSGGLPGTGGLNGSGGVPGTGGVKNPGGAGGAVEGLDAGRELIETECFSPAQFLDVAYDPSFVGCKCAEGAQSLCRSGVALICSEGRWQAVQDGPCASCWTSEAAPETIFDRPEAGCACSSEGDRRSIYTTQDGYSTVVCSDGKWTLDPSISSWSCSSDAQCGYGGKCEGGTCNAQVCEVDGVRYAVGATLPSPFDCNTCTCEANGTLSCTRLPCPMPPACAPDMAPASVCVACGLVGGCGLTRTGCLPECNIDADCPPDLPRCDLEQNACSIVGCI